MINASAIDYRVNQRVDCRGLSSPIPMDRTRKAMQSLEPGQVLEVAVTDMGSLIDLRNWADRTGYQYLGCREQEGVFFHFLRNAAVDEVWGRKKHPCIIDSQELEKKLENPRVLLLDVREPIEYAYGHIPGAKHIPLRELQVRTAELDREKDIYVICRSGARSDAACQMLNQMGFTRLINVVPGMIGWNGPMENGH